MTDAGISCAILAGGKNRRFGGRPKADALVGGRRIIERITGEVEEIFREIIIVTNSSGDRGLPARYRITGDIYADAGPPGGIHAALNISCAENVFVLAADMPFINREIIQEQIEFFRTHPEADAVIPETPEGIEPLHGIYTRKVLPLLESMLVSEPGFPVYSFLEKINAVYFGLPFSVKVRKAFFNINTPADLAEAERLDSSGV